MRVGKGSGLCFGCGYLTGINAAAGEQLYVRNLFFWSYKKDGQWQNKKSGIMDWGVFNNTKLGKYLMSAQSFSAEYSGYLGFGVRHSYCKDN